MGMKFEKILPFMREFPTCMDAEKVMDLCWTIPLRRDEIARIESEVLILSYSFSDNDSDLCIIYFSILPDRKNNTLLTLCLSLTHSLFLLSSVCCPLIGCVGFLEFIELFFFLLL